MAVAALRMPCGHSCDARCLQQWFMYSIQKIGKMRCPVCRAEPSEVEEALELRRLVEERITSDPSLEPENRWAHFADPNMPLLPGPLDAFSAAAHALDSTLYGEQTAAAEFSDVDAVVRVALVTAAGATNVETRRAAIHILANLASNGIDVQAMRVDIADRGVLLAAAGGTIVETRCAAIHALANLSGNAANRQPMWADAARCALCSLQRLAKWTWRRGAGPFARWPICR